MKAAQAGGCVDADRREGRAPQQATCPWHQDPPLPCAGPSLLTPWATVEAALPRPLSVHFPLWDSLPSACARALHLTSHAASPPHCPELSGRFVTLFTDEDTEAQGPQGSDTGSSLGNTIFLNLSTALPEASLTLPVSCLC